VGFGRDTPPGIRCDRPPPATGERAPGRRANARGSEGSDRSALRRQVRSAISERFRYVAGPDLLYSVQIRNRARDA
jgi:hypothetical protein